MILVNNGEQKMPYDDVKIRYDVGYNKVIDRKTGKTIPDVIWIDEESQEYGQKDNAGNINTMSGDVMLVSTRRGDRRTEDRRFAPRRQRSRRE